VLKMQKREVDALLKTEVEFHLQVGELSVTTYPTVLIFLIELVRTL
jgi:hypothetical protein